MRIDPSAAAHTLAGHFYEMSQAVDDFRLSHEPALSNDQISRLDSASDALEDRANDFTAEAINATLEGIAPDLDKINSVIAQAAAQLRNLVEVDKIILIATHALNLGTSIVSGVQATILGAVQALEDVLYKFQVTGSGQVGPPRPSSSFS